MDFQSDGIRVSQSQAEGFGGLNQSEGNSRQLRQSVDSDINLDAETPSTPNNPLGKIPSVYFDESDTQQSQLSDPNAMRLNKITSNLNSQADHLSRMGQRRPTVEKKMNLQERSQEQLREEERKSSRRLYEKKDERYNYK